MSPSVSRPALVAGFGNEGRGDDGVGARVVERVVALHLPHVRVVRCPQPLDLVDELATTDWAVIVDAVRGAGPAGSVHVQPMRGTWPPRAPSGPSSSHGIGVADAVELARALGHLPEHVVFVGVEAASFAPGERLSDAVRGGVDAAVSAVVEHLPSGRGSPDCA